MKTRLVRTCTGFAVLIFLVGRSAPVAAETLQGLIATALAQHPDIAALEASVRAAQQTVSPARTLPDPQLMVGVANMGLTSWEVGKDPMSQVMVQVGQMIPVRGKRGLAAKVAEGDVAQAEAALDARRNSLAAQVARAALEIYRVDQSIAIMSSIHDQYVQMAKATEGRVTVGAAPQEELINMLLDRDMTGAEISEARLWRAALVAELNGLLARPPSALFDSLIVDSLPPVPADTAGLVAVALRDQPMIVERRAMVAQAEAARDLARRERTPDPMITAGYGYRDGMTGMYQATIGLSLPIWMNRRQNAEVRMRDEMLQMQRHEASAAEVSTTAMVGAATARLRAANELLRAYERELLPRAQQAVSASYASYTVGQSTLIMALDAARKWQRLRLEALDQEVMERMALVDLEEALGHAAGVAGGPTSTP